MQRPKRVALLIESSRASGRGLLLGIADYVRTEARWTVFHCERSLGDPAPRRLGAWRPDGIIARIESRTLLGQIKRLAVPTVDVLGWHPLPGVPRFANDRHAVALLAADHLRQRGLANFAYCGFAGLPFSQQRAESFSRYVTAMGCQCHLHETSKTWTESMAATEAQMLGTEKALLRWLRSLPKPVGLLGCNDACALEMLNVCGNHGLSVPDEVAVLGVDNDEILCELATPPLSSVELDNRRIGYDAALALDRMLQGRKPQAEEVRIPPRGVIGRRSTDVVVSSDEDVVAAIKLIRQHACDGLSVRDMLDQLALSPSTLRRRFRAVVDRSPIAEIIRVRIERARYLLATSTLSTERVAKISGFGNAQHLCKVFRRQTDMAPGEYRRRRQFVRVQNDALPKSGR